MKQNRQSTKIYVVHHDTLSVSFRIRIVWFQPKEDSDQIRISFFINRIGSDNKKTLSDHLWYTTHVPLVTHIRDERTVKFFSPSAVLIWKNWIRSSPDPQNFWKSSVRSSPDPPI